MTVRVEFIDPEKATFKQAQEVAAVYYDGFQNDALTRQLLGPRYTLPTPPPAGALRDYEKVLRVSTWHQWLGLKNPNNRTWAIYEDDKMVGSCQWTLPKALHTKPRLLDRIKFKLAQWYTGILKLWCFGFRKDPPYSNPDFFTNIAEAESEHGVTKLKVPETELAHLSRDELAKARYSANEYSWCNLVAIKSAYHGKGYGKKMFTHAMEHITRYEPVFKDGEVESKGPAKLGLLASPPGRKMYEKLGWQCLDVFEKIALDGTKLVFPLMVYTFD